MLDGEREKKRRHAFSVRLPILVSFLELGVRPHPVNPVPLFASAPPVSLTGIALLVTKCVGVVARSS